MRVGVTRTVKHRLESQEVIEICLSCGDSLMTDKDKFESFWSSTNNQNWLRSHIFSSDEIKGMCYESFQAGLKHADGGATVTTAILYGRDGAIRVMAAPSVQQSYLRIPVYVDHLPHQKLGDPGTTVRDRVFYLVGRGNRALFYEEI